jgi:hypothetical protein
MTDKGVNPLNPLLSKFQKLQASVDHGARWEAGRALYLLKELGMADKQRYLRDQDQAGNLTFSSVNSCLQLSMCFASYAMTGKLAIHRDTKHVHPLWFKNFEKLPFVVVYLEKYREYSCTSQGEFRPLCMVFPRKGFMQGMCIHNGAVDTYLREDSSGHVYRSGKYSQDFLVQPFQSVARILKGSLNE